MKKRLISIMLALVLIFGMCLQVSAGTEDKGLKQLPKLGTTISGFKVIELGNMELTNSKTVLFEHKKTGAQLLYVQNKDIDRSFSIAFRTPALDNTGANHILEHITVSGSKKYPVKNVLFTVANQTYSTYINALTSQNYTTYPVASMSEEQLLKLTDVYMDCVFHPSVYDDKNIFSREAWRYEMADANTQLAVTGTVFNEMKGAFDSISIASRFNTLRTLFPDSVESNVSGGDPGKIKDITYKQIIKTHKAYYHPSNSLMVLYGNLDYAKFLKLINDNYLSKYSKSNIKIDNGKVKPFTKKVVKNFKFPLSASSNTKNASQIDYAYALTNVPSEDMTGLEIICEILNMNTSPLKKAFNEKQIGGSVAVSIDTSLTQPVLSFIVQNADESKSESFKSLVDICMKDIVKKGFDKNALDAMFSAFLLSCSKITEQSRLGVGLSTAISGMWANDDNLNYFNNIIKNIKNLKGKTNSNYFEELADKYIVNNNHAALVTTVPEAGLAEKQAALQQKSLASLKASMSKKSIDQIVKDTKSYNEWNAKETDASIVKNLQAVKVSDLPVETKKYNIRESLSADGVRLVSAEANVSEMHNISFLFDTSAVPADKLHYLQLYASLLGRLDTNRYSRDQLSVASTRFLSGISYSLSTIKNKDTGKFTPVMSVSWMGLKDDYDKQLEIVKNVLTNTKYSNISDIENYIKSDMSSMASTFANNPVNLMIYRNLASNDDNVNYSNYTGWLDYYNFLLELEKKMKSDPSAVSSELDNMKQLVINKTNLIASYCGKGDFISKFEDSMKAFTSDIPKNAIAGQDYSKLPKPDIREGIAVDTSVQYNMISSDYKKSGTEFSGKFIPIASLINEKYTTPKIRFGNGAYDNAVTFSQDAMYVFSYRDPKIKETFDIYAQLPDFIRNINITQEELDRFIIKAFSSYSMPSGELSGAASALGDYLSGRKQEDKLKILSEIKSLTVKDVKDTAGIFEQFVKNGSYSTVGSPGSLAANKELYNKIISIGSQESGAITIKLLMQTLTGQQEPMAAAKQYGLVKDDDKGNYDENTKLTKESFAVFMCRIANLNKIKLEGKKTVISDENSVGKWAKDNVSTVVDSGIMKLDTDGKFNPKAEVNASYVKETLTQLSAKATAK